MCGGHFIYKQIRCQLELGWAGARPASPQVPASRKPVWPALSRGRPRRDQNDVRRQRAHFARHPIRQSDRFLAAAPQEPRAGEVASGVLVLIVREGTHGTRLFVIWNTCALRGTVLELP